MAWDAVRAKRGSCPNSMWVLGGVPGGYPVNLGTPCAQVSYGLQALPRVLGSLGQ
jgi:hypothetical protein